MDKGLSGKMLLKEIVFVCRPYFITVKGMNIYFQRQDNVMGLP